MVYQFICFLFGYQSYISSDLLQLFKGYPGDLM